RTPVTGSLEQLRADMAYYKARMSSAVTAEDRNMWARMIQKAQDQIDQLTGKAGIKSVLNVPANRRSTIKGSRGRDFGIKYNESAKVDEWLSELEDMIDCSCFADGKTEVNLAITSDMRAFYQGWSKTINL